MTNPPRQYHEDYWYHVYARSVAEVRMFETDVERRWFLERLDEVFSRRKVTLGALCLMDTHYHALVKMGPVSLDRALNGLHMSYTRHINAERGRKGTLFDDRPGADIVLNDTYLLQLVPYIHHNPTEAGLVSDPREYCWSTDGLYRGTGLKKEALRFSCWEFPPHFRGSDRPRVYQERMGEDVEEPEPEDGYIGTEAEWEQMERRREQRSGRPQERRGRRTMDDIAKKKTEGTDVTVDDLKGRSRGRQESEIRHEAMVEMYEEGFGPKEIGEFFNRSKAAVTYAVNKFNNE